MKLAAVKALVVLVPCYFVAWLTDKMVYVVPTLAAAGFFAASLTVDQRLTQTRLDDDTDTESDVETMKDEVIEDLTDSSDLSD